MAKNLALAQFVYKYPDESNITYGFAPGVDICKLLNTKEILSVGIQAPYGTKFFINGETAYIGPTGVFELDNVITIYSLIIGEESMVYLNNIIVDIIYNKGE